MRDRQDKLQATTLFSVAAHTKNLIGRAVDIAIDAHDREAEEMHREIVYDDDAVHDADRVVLKHLILIGPAANACAVTS